MDASQDSRAPVPESVMYIRADRSIWDWHNLVVAPLTELLSYKSLISSIISRDLKIRYKRSILGVAWTILAPLFSMAVMWAVFTYALKIDIPFYATYLLTGIICWQLFVQTSVTGTACIVFSAALLKKVRVPHVVFPLAVVVNNLVNFGFAFLALLLVVVLTGSPLHLTLLTMPVVMIPMILFAAGWAMFVSGLAVFFRDLQYILEVSLNAFFYLTPIVYQPSSLPEKYQWIVSFNPMAKFVHLLRLVVYTGELPQLRVYAVSLAIGALMFCIGWITFHRLQRRFIFWI